MTSLCPFEDISDEMLWKEPAEGQIARFRELGERLGVTLTVASSHRSKSIDLPVVQYALGGCIFLLRDNFYDINIHVNPKVPVTLPYAELFEGVFKELDWDWYLGEIERARGYSWKQWTDEQMDDRSCLRVFSESYGREIDWDKTPGEKDRWIKRLESPEWIEMDWSSGSLSYEGEFESGVRMYKQPTAFAQGIDSITSSNPPYSPGAKQFILAVANIEAAELIIRRVVEAVK